MVLQKGADSEMKASWKNMTLLCYELCHEPIWRGIGTPCRAAYAFFMGYFSDLMPNRFFSIIFAWWNMN